MALSDRKLNELAKKHMELKSREAKAKADALKIQGRIVKELKRRGTKALETEDVRITVVAPEQVEYDPEELQASLSPSKFRKITERVINKTALSREVQAGRIDGELVAKCSKVNYKSPYIRVSGRSE